MLKVLQKLVKERQYSQIRLHDGSTYTGFVVYAGKDTVVMKCLDDVGEPKEPSYSYYEWDDDGNLLNDDEDEDAPDTDMILTEEYFCVHEVNRITKDVSHRVNADVWKTMVFLRDNELFDHSYGVESAPRKAPVKKVQKKVKNIEEKLDIK